MHHSHMDSIKAHFKGEMENCDMKVRHNEERPLWVIEKAVKNINNALKNNEQLTNKKRGLSIVKMNGVY